VQLPLNGQGMNLSRIIDPRKKQYYINHESHKDKQYSRVVSYNLFLYMVRPKTYVPFPTFRFFYTTAAVTTMPVSAFIWDIMNNLWKHDLS
jgi:hypothetical protein